MKRASFVLWLLACTLPILAPSLASADSFDCGDGVTVEVNEGDDEKLRYVMEFPEWGTSGWLDGTESELLKVTHPGISGGMVTITIFYLPPFGYAVWCNDILM